jgi:hypothetical protein
LAQAADAMSANPGALQLRLLQTVADVASEKNSTLVMPFPVELLRFFERATGGPPRDRTEGVPGTGSPAELPAADGAAELTDGQVNGVPAGITRDSGAGRG